MPKGKTNRPMRIMVPVEWTTHPVFVALADAGHVVVPMDADIDLLLHPKAHWCDDGMVADDKLIGVALKWARKHAD